MRFKRRKILKKFDPEKEQNLHDEIQSNGGLEKNDMKAMILAALLTIMPIAVGVFLLFILLAWLFI